MKLNYLLLDLSKNIFIKVKHKKFNHNIFYLIKLEILEINNYYIN